MTNVLIGRELLERVSRDVSGRENWDALEPDAIQARKDIRAFLSAPSPAGVDGLDVVSNWVLFDAEADKPYIKKMLPEGFLAFFDCEEDARRAKANNPGTDYKRIDRVKAEDAQAIIDGLRGEVAELKQSAQGKLILRLYQHAKRIGELEGLLIPIRDGYDSSMRACLEDDNEYMADQWREKRDEIDAALSAGKEGE